MGDKKFATLFTMKNKSGDDGSDDSDDNKDEGQAFYAGGSEHSGQQILGPGKKKASQPGQMIDEVFSAAKAHGAEVVNDNEPSLLQEQKRFTGSGYKLGSDESSDPVIINQQSTSQSQDPGAGQHVEMVLKMWRNGFSVDDGPLRDFNDAQGKAFLHAIQRGEIPQELIHAVRGRDVGLNMEDHRSEDYQPPKVVTKPFQGQGHMLGSPVPSVSSGSGEGRQQQSGTEQPIGSAVSVDTTQPVTTLQIRLTDGTRLVEKFNTCHTVSDVRNYIIAYRPEYAGLSFVLMTTFPNREITDESESLDAAKLLNAVIVQRLTG